MFKWLDMSGHSILIAKAFYKNDSNDYVPYVCLYKKSGFDESERQFIRSIGFLESDHDSNFFGKKFNDFDVDLLHSGFNMSHVVNIDENSLLVRHVDKSIPFRERGSDKKQILYSSNKRPRFDLSTRVVKSSSSNQKLIDVDKTFVLTENEIKDGKLNPFQMNYSPKSSIGSPIAAVPINLYDPTNKALDRLVKDRGNIDEYVSSRLHWTIEEMERYLSPEQVDAVGLILFSVENKKAFVLADATGLGKGRVLAAVCRAVVLSGEKIIFITEKKNLFSDLWRDIVDIGSSEIFGRPLMLNDKATIVDTSSPEGKIIHDFWKPKEIKDIIKSMKIPDDVFLFMSSYSQFNREGSAKSDFLNAISVDRILLCDESHNAVGDSNTSLVLSSAMDAASSVIYSSATFARGAKNLAAYKRLFPKSMRSSDLMSILESGGHAISEALTQMLVEDGSYLRREHDLSDLLIEVVDDTERLERNKKFADALSPILSKVAELSRGVSDIVKNKNEPYDVSSGQTSKKGAREFWSSGNFGARLGLILRQFVTALKVDFCIENSVSMLMRGEKPTIVLESTMESLMRDLLSDKVDDVDDASDIDEIDGSDLIDDDDPVEQSTIISPPTFRDALNLLVDRTMQITVRRGKEDIEKIEVDDPYLVQMSLDIKNEILSYPEMPLSPIDDIRDGIVRVSEKLFDDGKIDKLWVVDEISARKLRVVNGVYDVLPVRDRVGVVAKFQAGDIDAIILTRAASTGLSLHASEKVKDKRKRHMIELQIPSNVVERVQFWGRVKRRGQVVEPSFTTLSTGLPLENRSLAIQNRKVADLSANVTASAESATAMKVPDIIDQVGNRVAKRYLEDNPKLADDMHIPLRLKDMDTAEAELYHINKILHRLVLLPSNLQERVYSDIVASYNDAIREMSAKGQSPKGARELSGLWRVVSREVFESGDFSDGEVFGRDVTLTTIETTREVNPITLEKVFQMVEAGHQKLTKLKHVNSSNLFSKYDDAILEMRPKLLENAMPRNSSEFFMNYQAALKDQRPNAVKVADERIFKLRNLLKILKPGVDISVKTDDGVSNGVIVEVRPPYDLKMSHQASRWIIKYVVPGDENVQEISAASVGRDGSVNIMGHNALDNHLIRKKFEMSKAGEIVERRQIFDGNPVKSIVLSRKLGWGSMTNISYEDGTVSRSLLIPKNITKDIYSLLDGRTFDSETALQVLIHGGTLWTDSDHPENGATFEFVDEFMRIEVSADKKIFKLFDFHYFKDNGIFWKGTGQTRWVHISKSKSLSVLKEFLENEHVFNYDGHFRKILSSCDQVSFSM